MSRIHLYYYKRQRPSLKTKFKRFIRIIDTESGKKIKTIEVGERTHGIDIGPTGEYVLVAAGRSGGPILAVIDTDTNEITATITEDMQGPTHMSFSPDGQRAYIADPVANGVVVVDMQALKVEAAWPSGSDGAQETRPSPDGKQVFVSDSKENMVVVFDSKDFKELEIFDVGISPHGIDFISASKI